MSIRIMSQAWDVDLPDSEKLILLALADWSNDDGVCWPSVPQLAKKSSKSERTVQTALKSLEAAGHITRDQRIGRGCNYTIHPRKGCTPAAAAPVKRLRPAAAAPTPAAAAPNTSVTHQASSEASPPSKARAKPASFLPPSDIPEAEWDAFEEMRRKIGKPLTDTGRRLAIERLRKFADDGWPPGDVLNHSILNNYQGLFPPKDGRHGALKPNSGPGLRGSRPDPAVDLRRYAETLAAEEAASGDCELGGGFGVPLPSYLTG